MNWLISPPLRRPMALAALASLLLNLALLMPSLYLLQLFDRVFASRSLETLAMLTLLATLALGLAWAMDRARALALARAGLVIDALLAPPALACALAETAAARRAAETQPVHDVARLRAFLGSPAVHALFDAPWLPLYLAVIYALHPALGVAATLAATLLFALGLASERLLRHATQAAADAGRSAARRIDALSRHAEVLVGMGMLTAAVAHWGAHHDQAVDSQRRAGDRHATLAATGRTLRQGVQVGLLALGAWLVVAEQGSPGIMVAATLLAARALQPVEHLIAGWKALLDVRSAWQRLRCVPDEGAAAPALRLPEVRGELQLERVSLVVAGAAAPVVKSVSLSLPAGSCLGLIGPSGSGKTMLVRLMLGLRVPQAGTVRLDGIDLAAWPREQRAAAVGWLPQDVQLFAGSVAQNIARLGPVDADQVIAAARLAGVHELIAALPKAYDTEIGDDGSHLSGGQRQRIGLARALYGMPRLVLLDEPDAGLDDEGDAALSRAIEALKQAGSSVVLVSHRPWLMRHADRLAVLRRGALEISGARDEVLACMAGRTVRPLRARDRGGLPVEVAAMPGGRA